MKFPMRLAGFCGTLVGSVIGTGIGYGIGYYMTKFIHKEKFSEYNNFVCQKNESFLINPKRDDILRNRK